MLLNEGAPAGTADSMLDATKLTTLLEEVETTMFHSGVDMTAPDAMRRIYSDRSVADMYIDGLAEGLNPEDTKYFKSLCNNMLDEITGAGPFANSGGTLSMLCENTSAAFMPKAKVLFPMFRFTWPRLHIREICTVIPMDSPEIVRYFFKAVAKNTDDSIIPLPSYSPIGNGIAIGTASRPKEVSLPGTVDLLNSVGLDNKSASLEKMFTIVG